MEFGTEISFRVFKKGPFSGDFDERDNFYTGQVYIFLFVFMSDFL